MDTLSIKEAADLWCLSEQMVRRYCKEGKIEGAVRVGRSWVIPADTKYIDQQEIVLSKSTPKLASQIIKQKNYKKAFHGLYDYLQIYMTYSSCRMASCRLTMDHIDMIFRKGKVVSRFEPLKVSDLIEALNHFACIDYVLDHLMEPLTQRYIKKLHSLLVMGTVDERKERVVAGRYRPEGYTIKDRTLIPAQLVPDELDRIIQEYEAVQQPEISDVLNFHVEFEILAPFRDYNGRLGRLVMLKECLRHSITPFVLDDKRRGDYLDGIKKWSGRRKLLIGVVAEAQERFESAIERQELRRYGLEYEPPGYSNN